MAEMAVGGEGAATSPMERLAIEICDAATKQNKDELRHLIKVVFGQLQSKIIVVSLEEQQVELITMIINEGESYEFAVDKLIGVQPPFTHFKNAVDALELVIDDTSKVWQLQDFGIYQILKLLVEYLTEYSSENNEMKYCMMIRNNYEFLSFFLKEVCFFINKWKTILSATVWFFYFKTKKLEYVKALWKNDYKQMAFSVPDRDLLILGVQSNSIMLLRFILSKYSYEDCLKHPEDLGIMTFFQYAVSFQNKIIVKEILSRTPKKLLDKMINDQFGSAEYSPLHLAAYYGDYDMVKLLCEFGARYCPHDKNDETPADLAKKSTNPNLISFFDRLDFMFQESKKGNFIDLVEYDRDDDQDKLAFWNAQDERGFSVSDYYLETMI